MSKHLDVTKYHSMSVEELNKLHTGTLMNIRKASFKDAPSCACCGEKVRNSYEQEFAAAQHQLRNNLKEVLKTREHVPTKAQRREARQAAAKKGK